MAQTIWSGSVSFGLVNVPVKLYSATSARSVRFNQLNKSTGAKVKQKRVDEKTGDEVAFENIVKGYELTPGRFVVIEPEELASLAPAKTRTVDIEKFVPADQIDPMLYDNHYYVAPDTGAAKAYKLLVTAMEKVGKVAVAKIILRTKESLVALRAKDGVLVMSTLVWNDELNPADTARPDVEVPEPSERETNMAVALVESLTDDFQHDEYQDGYRAMVLDLIERKAAGEEIAMPVAETPTVSTPDLMASLEASLSKVKKAKKSTPRKQKVTA